MSYSSNFRKAGDIIVPEQMFNPIKTGVYELDDVFSAIGGIIPSQVILVTGNPGSGKTTLCSVIGSCLTQTESRPIVFLSYEMSDFQLKLQAQKIQGFSDMLISTHKYHEDVNGFENLFNDLDEINPCLVIVDSLQKMASTMSSGPTRGQIQVVNEFTKWAKKSFCPVFLIGHNDKGGNYAGPAFLKHEVDSHMSVRYDKESRERLFSMSKNRFGGNTEEYSFKITSNGVVIGAEDWSSNVKTDEEARDIVIDFKTISEKSRTVNWEKFQDTAKTVIAYLNNKYAEKMKTETFINDYKKVKLTWNGKRACCNHKTGVINFGHQIFQKINNDNFDIVGYRSEKPYIRNFVKTKEDACIWVIIHEWVHLFKDYQKHSSVMWREISRIASEESWLWSSSNNNA